LKLSSDWTFLKKEDIWQTYTYKERGKITKQKEAISRCQICGNNERDLVGLETTGGYLGTVCWGERIND